MAINNKALPVFLAVLTLLPQAALSMRSDRELISKGSAPVVSSGRATPALAPAASPYLEALKTLADAADFTGFTAVALGGTKRTYADGIYRDADVSSLLSFTVPKNKTARLCSSSAKFGSGTCVKLAAGIYGKLPTGINPARYLEVRDTTTQSTLLINNGFEGTCAVTASSDPQTSNITGADTTLPSPNDWNKNYEQGPYIGDQNISYEGGNNSQRYAKVITDPNNAANRVLQFWIGSANVVDSNGNPYKARVQQNIMGNTDLREFTQTVKMQLPTDMAVIKDFPLSTKWLTIAEYWNNAGWTGEPYPFRISVNIAKLSASAGAPLYLSVHGQVLDQKTNTFVTVWESTNEQFQVPFGKWMTLEYYVREGNASTGRFYLAVTPENQPKQVVFDLANFTHHPDDPAPNGFAHIQQMKAYTSKNLIDYINSRGKTFQILWDDFAFSVVKCATSDTTCRGV